MSADRIEDRVGRSYEAGVKKHLFLVVARDDFEQPSWASAGWRVVDLETGLEHWIEESWVGCGLAVGHWRAL